MDSDAGSTAVIDVTGIFVDLRMKSGCAFGEDLTLKATRSTIFC
jgi:hypothetical protein